MTNQKIQGYTSWQIYFKLLKSAAPYWLSFVLGIFGTLLATGTDAAMTWAIKPILNNWDVSEKLWWFKWLPLVIIAVLFLRGCSYFFSTYYLTRVGRNVVRDFRQSIFSHLLHLPVNYYDKETSGKLLSVLVYNTEQVANASTEALITLLQEGLLLIFLIGVMLNVSWQLTLMFIVTSPLVALIISYTSKRLRRLSTNVQGSMGDLTHIAQEGIENYKVIRLFGGEKYEKDKFDKIAHHNRQREMKVVATSSLGTSLTQIISSIPIAIIVFVATLPTLQVGMGAFAAIVVTILRVLTPLRRLTKINTQIQKGVAGAYSIFSLLDEQKEIDKGVVETERVSGKIEYKEVNFSYPTSKKITLHNINFKADPGQKIALVGSSGSGKSTLVNLLPRFYDIFEGSIFIDDVSVQDYKLSSLREQFAVVSQHLTLFNDTIAKNIAYGSLQDVTEEKIKKAAKAAHILDFIEQLPKGFETLVGENGLLLSGGQRQRIAIARAILKDAPILILDEATSALDTESERYIQDALEILTEKRTTLVIAHRLSTVEGADKIIVLDQGKIIETGTHNELLTLNGQYAKLYNMQFEGN